MTAVLTMVEAAREVGMSYDRFRKAWPRMRAELGFPSPFAGHKWDAETVRAWRKARSLAAPEFVEKPRRDNAGARARARLDALRVA